ncbi:hypothetical protein B0H16DRAFT_1494951 [Mycena metata]|uniref:THO1-MOS11 C-terminal domain-containing protein n=1 Tax=Mycena metata TaxID=1033252 RepID=A0AAD7KEG7_9AGAR|nr:hypothetical protein B0H16DRAFT_1494951 [Mycena metata]
MESKLKTLKVAELKDILTKAQQPPPAKATKGDLIARILASKEAAEAYNAKFAPKDDLLAPPEDLDWDVDQVNAPETPVEAPKPPSAAKPAPAPATAKATPIPTSAPAPTAAAAAPTPAPTATGGDAEAEKRRKRAERFGLPVVEPKSPAAKKAAVPAAAAAKQPKQPDVPEKLSARAARFGTGQKRPAPVDEVVDEEEQEKRKKRAERFGTGAAKEG